MGLSGVLDEKRVTEAERNVRQYMQDGLLKRHSFSRLRLDTFMRNHRESLSVADHIRQHDLSNLWVVVASYYSMFYIANAVLCAKGYRVGHRVAHKVTADTIITHLRDELNHTLISHYEMESSQALSLTDSLLSGYDSERIKRSAFQYESTEDVKSKKATTSLTRAKAFSFEVERVLKRLL